MTVLLEIKDSKAPFMMELLHNFSFVKAQPFSVDNEFIQQETKTFNKDPFAEVRGIWANREIDGATLRKQAWGIEI